MSEASADICTRSAAKVVTFPAVWVSAGAAWGTGCGGVPGCKSTRTELLPGRSVRWESPATTSTSSGGSAVRMVVTGATGSDGAGVWTAIATWFFDPCFDLAAVTGLAATAEGSGACLAGTLSAGWSDSASGASGNQKSRSCQSTTPSANRSRQSDPTINLRCLGSSGTLLTESASRARSGFFAMVFSVDIVETGTFYPGGGLAQPLVCLENATNASISAT